ncbi:MAG: DUF4870 domain-containing protein [Cellulosilyticum sp.]|nr:DUF4870 domain-containing protein [Cellulosilyticum sp.]
MNSSGSNKLMAVISYLSVFSIVALIFSKDSKFVRYHANQGLCLLIAEVIVGIVKTVVCTILGFIPFIGGIVGIFFYLVGVFFLVLSILGIVNVAKDEMKPLPIVGGFKIIS